MDLGLFRLGHQVQLFDKEPHIERKRHCNFPWEYTKLLHAQFLITAFCACIVIVQRDITNLRCYPVMQFLSKLFVTVVKYNVLKHFEHTYYQRMYMHSSIWQNASQSAQIYLINSACTMSTRDLYCKLHAQKRSFFGSEEKPLVEVFVDTKIFDIWNAEILQRRNFWRNVQTLRKWSISVDLFGMWTSLLASTHSFDSGTHWTAQSSSRHTHNLSVLRK